MLVGVPKKRLLLAALSGLATALAMPNELLPQGSPLVGLVCLVPYFLALRRGASPAAPPTILPKRWSDRIKEDALVGAVYGGVSGFLTNYWLMFFGEFSVWTIGGTTVAYALYHTLLAPILASHRRLPGWARPVALALYFAAYDYLRSIGFLGYPWSLMGYPAASLPVVIQHVDVTGVWLLSFIVVLGNAVVTEAVESWSQTAFPKRRTAVATGGSLFVLLILGVCIYGTTGLRREFPLKRTLRMVLIQQNSDSWARGNELPALAKAQSLTTAGLEAASLLPGDSNTDGGPPIDLIVWSETSLRRIFADSREFYSRNPETQPFLPFLAELPAPLLTGGPVRFEGEDRRVGNGALLVEPTGAIRQWYAKQHLVPFAEHIPFWESPLVQSFFRTAVGLGGVWTPGREYRLFEMDWLDTADGEPLRFGTPICFEDAFGYLAREFILEGADLLINLTNNSWSRTDSAQIQHYVAARFRAIENRTTLVRSTNSGLTTVVDPWGRETNSLPMFESAYLVVDVPIYDNSSKTFYTRHGDYLGRVFVLLSLALLTTTVVHRFRRRFSPTREVWED